MRHRRRLCLPSSAVSPHPPRLHLALLLPLPVLVVPQPLVHVLTLGPRLAHLLVQPLRLLLLLAGLAACRRGAGWE